MTNAGSLLVLLAIATACQSPQSPSTTQDDPGAVTRSAQKITFSTDQVPSDLRTLLLAAPHESLEFKGHYGRTSQMDEKPEAKAKPAALVAATTVVHLRTELFVVDAALLPSDAPLAVRVEADAVGHLMAALVHAGHAERLHTPYLSCNDGQEAYASLVGQHSVVRGFEVKATGSQFITEPDVATVTDGLRLTVRPQSAANDSISLTMTLESTQLQRPIPTIETTYGIKIQTPTFLNQHLETKALLGKNEGLLVAGIQATDRSRVIIALLQTSTQALDSATR